MDSSPYPTNGSAQERQEYDEEAAQTAWEWVAEYPDNLNAWLRRLNTAVRLKSTPNQESEQIGDTVLRLAREHPLKGFRFVRVETEVAEAWDMRNIRLEQIASKTILVLNLSIETLTVFFRVVDGLRQLW